MSKFQIAILSVLGVLATVLGTMALTLGVIDKTQKAEPVVVYIPVETDVEEEDAEREAATVDSEADSVQDEDTMDEVYRELHEAVQFDYLNRDGFVRQGLSADEIYIIAKDLPPKDNMSIHEVSKPFLTKSTVGRLSTVIIEKFCTATHAIRDSLYIEGSIIGERENMYYFTVTPNPLDTDEVSFTLNLYCDPFKYEILDLNGKVLATGGAEVVLGDITLADDYSDAWKDIKY